MTITPVNADQLRVTVEMGDAYEPSERVAAALGELTAALVDETGDDVAGFGDPLPTRSFYFDSGIGSAIGGLTTFPKVELFNKADAFDKSSRVFKF